MLRSTFPDRSQIREHQLHALRALFEALTPHNAFYAPRIREAALEGGPPDLETFFARMPFTSKQSLVDDQRAHPPYGTNLTYPLWRYTRFSQTSGTTGAPIRWLDTNESWNWMVDNWIQVMQASGVRRDDHIFFAFSFGPFLGFWTAFEAGIKLGCMCLPGGGMSSVGRLHTILENRATVLCCTPTYAIRLGEVAAEERIDLSESRVRSIIVAGEPGAGIPATRRRIEQYWPGAAVYDHHGMTEIGPVTFECPVRRGTLHVIESSYIPEVIAPDTAQPLAPGTQGELVLTNLGRTGSPLIRYRTGDLVQTAEQSPCACGRYDMALEGGILGRTDDMAIVRGVNLHPTAVEEIIRRFDRIAEYQAEIYTERAMLEIRLRVEPTPDCPDREHLRHEIEAELRAAFNLRIPVLIERPGTLPRYELKAKRWIRLT
jgi:phenylacetate-CoA ligase